MPLFQAPSLSVTELTHYLRDLLENDEVLQDVWVQGEISNLSQPTSGHKYFTLKDGAAALKCVIWRSAAMRIRFAMQNGMAIEAHGAISLYERDGQYQLYVDGVRPAGEGLLFAQFMRLKAALEAEGLFDEERKRPLPVRPARIGIVTSPTGAALQDMLNTLRSRYPLVEVVLSPCAVQGDAAPMEIVKALRCLCEQAKPDVIIMARGGGSLEDLWAFNEELVVRAVAASPIPVITGIGHETDFTLCDFVSDARAPTPTGAAVMATPSRADLIAELDGMRDRLDDAMLEHIAQNRIDLESLVWRIDRASPDRRIQNERQALDTLQARALRGLSHTVQLQRAHMGGLQSRLSALNPAAILQRGFALVERPGGGLVRSINQAQPGDPLTIRIVDGSLGVRVEQVSKENGPGSPGEQENA